MKNTSNKRTISPTVQQPAARWAFVLAVCAALGVVVSYCWRVFYGLDARGVSAAGVTGLCVGLAVLAGAATLALRRVRDFAKKGAACILLCAGRHDGRAARVSHIACAAVGSASFFTEMFASPKFGFR